MRRHLPSKVLSNPTQRQRQSQRVSTTSSYKPIWLLKTKELDKLKELSTMLKGVDYSQTKIQTSGSGNAAFVNQVNELVELENKINAKLSELKELRSNIWKAIYTLENTEERLVCLYRYLKFYDWDTVSSKMHLSPRQVHRVHGLALNHIKI